MNDHVKTILDIEHSYNHSVFMENAKNGDLDDQYRRLTEQLYETIDNIQKGLDTPLPNSLLRLIQTGGLTPECAGYILAVNFPEATETFDLLRNVYHDISELCSDVFFVEYHRKCSEEFRKRVEDFDDDLNAQHFINASFADYYGKANKSVFKGKCAVYTVITGGYDELTDPRYVDADVDYYFFTDHPDKYSSDIWKICELNTTRFDSKLLSQRWAKMHPHELLPEYDYTIYVDGKLTIKGSLKEYINTYARSSTMLCCPHPTHRDIKEEAEFIAMLGKWDMDSMEKQYREYYMEGYHDERILIESAILVRSNRDEQLKRVMDDWWIECMTKTGRDQLSFGYACWKNNYEYDISALNFSSLNRWIELKGHN